MNAKFWYCMCVVFEFLKSFSKIFLMPVNECVCEIILIISESTDYELSVATLSSYHFYYYYHGMYVYTDWQQYGKRLAAYGFPS